MPILGNSSHHLFGLFWQISVHVYCLLHLTGHLREMTEIEIPRMLRVFWQEQHRAADNFYIPGGLWPPELLDHCSQQHGASDQTRRLASETFLWQAGLCHSQGCSKSQRWKKTICMSLSSLDVLADLSFCVFLQPALGVGGRVWDHRGTPQKEEISSQSLSLSCSHWLLISAPSLSFSLSLSPFLILLGYLLPPSFLLSIPQEPPLHPSSLFQAMKSSRSWRNAGTEGSTSTARGARHRTRKVRTTEAHGLPHAWRQILQAGLHRFFFKRTLKGSFRPKR